MEIVAYFYPDMLEKDVDVQSGISIEEYFDQLRVLCERHQNTLHRAHVLIYAKESGEQILSITGSTKKMYALKEKYKEYDSAVWEICKKYFKDAKERNQIKIRNAEELRNTDVLVKGYTIPQDYDYGPDYYVKCNMSEALEKMKEIINSCPEEFSNLQFHVWTRDEDYLFCIRRDLDTIHLGSNNFFDLTKDMVKEALGLKTENRLPGELLSKKVIFQFTPDGKEPYICFRPEMSLGECFESIREHCETLEEYMETMEIMVYSEEEEVMFGIYAMGPSYHVTDRFKELEPVVSDIFNKYFGK